MVRIFLETRVKWRIKGKVIRSVLCLNSEVCPDIHIVDIQQHVGILWIFQIHVFKTKSISILAFKFGDVNFFLKAYATI